ncbi:MAG: SDR family oxidoreductase [Thaumarchaeota archaeon]|nr:SDR family oxidoreductase [Nitrososphaerota archaeon]
MKILVTGGAGYVGSVVIPELVKEGHYIKCLDRFFFGSEYLSGKEFENKIELVRDDIRWFDQKILEGVDLVMDLAALSNDPVGDLDPSKTFDINHLGRSRVARLSKDAGIQRYILASSASIYGQQDGIADENSQVKPLTAYSKANRMAEVDNLPLNDENFTVTALRFSSIYGLSPRMRFDLAVNSMALELFKTGKIIVRGKSNTRPFLHIKDATRVYSMIIKAPQEKIGGQIFNVGSDEQNYRMDDLAKEVGNSIGKKYEIEAKDTQDHRSYRASFKKIRETLGFQPKFTVKDGAVEIYKALESGELTDSKKTITVEWYKHLQSTPSLSKELSLRDIIL